jgi:hypothetical protein
LKADKSAYIALSAVEGQVDIDMIEVQLGIDNNMRSSIRPMPNGDTDVVTVDTPSILDSSQFRSFWVSWANGHIRVGKGGNVHINEFMSYPDPTPQKVGAVGFAADSTADSAWVITKLLGECALCSEYLYLTLSTIVICDFISFKCVCVCVRVYVCACVLQQAMDTTYSPRVRSWITNVHG